MTFPFSGADDRTPPIDPPVIGPVVARQGQRPPPVPQQETLVPPLFVRGGSAQPSPASFDRTEDSEREAGRIEPEMVDSSHHPTTAEAPTLEDDWWLESAATETGIEVSALESSFSATEEVDLLEDEGMGWSVPSDHDDRETRGVLPPDVGADAGDTNSPDRIADGFELDGGGPGEWINADSADEVEMGSEPASEEDSDVFGSDTVDISARSTDAPSDRPEVDEWSMEEDTEPWRPVRSVEDGTPGESTEALSDGAGQESFETGYEEGEQVAPGVASIDIMAATMLDPEDVDDHLGTDEPDPVEEMAKRLEDMAATLRSAGATGPLTKHATDPLGALIAGYLLGISGASSEDSPPSEG